MGGAAAQQPQQQQQRPRGHAEEAHVDELGPLPGEGPQQLEEGAPVHAHPHAHGEEGEAAELQGAEPERSSDPGLDLIDSRSDGGGGWVRGRR